MIIDFHTHGKLAKHLPFSSEYIKRLFGEAEKAGLDAICLTEHFNTLGFTELYQYIIDTFPRKGDSFRCGKLKIFTGMETDIAEGGHVLLIGSIENVFDLHSYLIPYIENNDLITFKRLLGLAREYSFLLGAAHPFRKGGNIPLLPDELLKQLDFIDLNGKDVGEQGKSAQWKVNSLAMRLSVPVIAGSDTHQFLQYGSVYNDFRDECATVGQLRENMRQGAYSIHICGNVELRVRAARILKSALKEIQALGGDYVSVLTKDNKPEITI